jgi:aryl-alcohol dehydrogenase-like predicted oxidoreductase
MARNVLLPRRNTPTWLLAWVHDRPGVASSILGTRTVTQLETNLGAVGLHLTAEETTLLGRLVFGAAC